MNEPYDPLDYENLARSVVNALLAQAPAPLPLDVAGAGVYAIYYAGALEYRDSEMASDPIYVGKAMPSGGRTGGGKAGQSPDRALYRRLRDHTESISQATNLSVAKTECRYLVVVPVWISLAEQLLLRHFRPLWNSVIDGFGNHDPGRGRRTSARPRWDILHPGREWAGRLSATEDRATILADVQKSLIARSGPP